MADFSATSQLAYELWEKGGRRDGTAAQNWLEAERILASREPVPLTGPLTDQAVDQLLTAPGLPPPPAPPPRARKVAATPSAAKASAKSSRKRASAETPKVGSRDAPGG
jgi:hypothetical protein